METDKLVDGAKIAAIARDYFENIYGNNFVFTMRNLKKHDSMWIIICDVGTLGGTGKYKLTIDPTGCRAVNKVERLYNMEFEKIKWGQDEPKGESGLTPVIKESTEIKNARIINTHLGPSEGTAFTFFLELDNGHGFRNVGNLDMGSYNKDLQRYEGWSGAIPMLIEIMNVVDVDNWDEMPGKYIRYKESAGRVYAIGNIIEDKWLNFGEWAGDGGYHKYKADATSKSRGEPLHNLVENLNLGKEAESIQVGIIPVHLNPKAYIGTNIKEGTTDISINIQYTEVSGTGKGKYLVVMWEDGHHHEVRFPIYLLEAQALCQK
jgi:hypothetical protein